jgi:hypothetical protein
MEMPPGPPPVGAPAPPPERATEVEPAVEPPSPEREGILTDEAANRRLVATTAALALLAVAVMLGVFLLTRDDGGEDDLAGPPPLPPVTVPAPTAPAEDGVAPASGINETELVALVAEIQDYVAAERGLAFRGDVDVEVLSRDDFEARALAEFDETFPDREEDVAERVALFQALGLWPVDADPRPMLRDLEVAGRVGFYDPITDTLVVSAATLSPLLEVTLAHALTHALDDQHFDLDHPELAPYTGDAALAYQAAVEGDARRIELAYQATMTDIERDAITAESSDLLAAVDLSGFPPVLLAERGFPVEVGQAFVQAVYEDGGNRALNRLFRTPPTASEQILEPGAWLEDEAPQTVEVPEADAPATDDGVAGQLLLDLIARTERPTGIPIPQWDGDRYVLWVDGDRVCARITIAGDAEGFETQLTPWAEQVGAELTTDGATTTATSCQ